jgi:hypothetical protein
VGGTGGENDSISHLAATAPTTFEATAEAAVNGTPTVAFRATGGVCESVRHGSTGLLADDLDEFTRHLAWVLLNRHLRERLGEAARADAARCTWPQAVAAFAAVLDQATASDAPCSAGTSGHGQQETAPVWSATTPSVRANSDAQVVAVRVRRSTPKWSKSR